MVNQKKLDNLLQHSHSPYSNVKVAAIIKTKSGEEFSGVNVENAAFPSSICAERSAMFSAISQGVKPGEIIEVNLTSNLDRHLYPCGGCRQVMSELLDKSATINIYYNGEVVSKTLEELIPNIVESESFGWK